MDAIESKSTKASAMKVTTIVNVGTGFVNAKNVSRNIES